MTDYKALCAELTEALHRYQCWYIEDNGYGLHDPEALLRRADAALAQPEPEGPSDEDLDLVVIAIQALIPPQPDATTHHLSAVDRGREILRQRLAHWVHPTPPVVMPFFSKDTQVIEPPETTLLVPYLSRPVPVSERLPVPKGPDDEALLELMPETMRDEFSYAATVCSDATGKKVKPGIFRVCLNTAALEYARAILARWGNYPAIPDSSPLP